MPRIIEAVYENGVFKPLEKVDLPQGSRVFVKIESERGVLTEDFLNELRKMTEVLPKAKLEKKLDEIYYEGKMLR